MELRNLLGILSQNYKPNGWRRRTVECLALGIRNFFIDQTDCVAVRGGAGMRGILGLHLPVSADTAVFSACLPSFLYLHAIPSL